MACRIERFDMGPDRCGDCGHSLAFRRVANDERRFGVREEIVEFGERIGAVERQIGRSRTHGGIRERQRRNGFFDVRRDAVAGFHAARDEKIGETAGEGEEFRISQPFAVERFDGQTLRIAGFCGKAGE